MSFSFMHGADLHIGSTISGVQIIPKTLKQRLLDASFQAFNNLIVEALVRQVDFVLLSGDVFEDINPSLRAQKVFCDGITKLDQAGIPVYMVTGNHDYNVIDRLVYKLPKNAHWFPQGRVGEYSFTIEDTVIRLVGTSYPSREVRDDLSTLFPPADKDCVTIGLLHCHLAADSTYAPTTLESLWQVSYNYWALGHVHTNTVWQEHGYIVYPGILQGRHSKETGSKGCYYLQYQEGIITPAFIPVQDLTWECETLDLSDVELDQLYQILNDCMNQHRHAKAVGVLLDVVLAGTPAFYSWLQQGGEVAEMLEDLHQGEDGLENFVLLAKLTNATKPSLDWDQLQLQTDFLGDFVRLCLKDRSDTELKTAIETILSPVTQHRDIDLDYEQILAKALAIGVKLLGGQE